MMHKVKGCKTGMAVLGLGLLLVALLLAACGKRQAEVQNFQKPELESTLDWRKLAQEHSVQALTLDNGIRVFLVRDEELPLVRLRATIRSGRFDVPRGKEGLARLTAEVMRSGGSEDYPAGELDRLLENNAASMSFSFGMQSGSASLGCLKEDFPDVFSAFADVLTNPRFPRGKIALAEQQMRTSISRRNDEQGDIAFRKFNKLIYGPDTLYSRVPEYKSLDRIERQDLVDFHQQAFRGENIYLGVVGDFSPERMRSLLEKELSGIPRGGANKMDFPEVDSPCGKGVYLVDKPDVNQSYILKGHLGGYRQSPDYPELQVMNEILSGGFSGRLFQEIRTRRGLAYSVFGRFEGNYYYPGLFYIGLQTKTENTVRAIREVQQQLQDIRQNGVSEEELQSAKDRFLNSMVFRYDSPGKVLDRRMYYEYRDMSPDSFLDLARNMERVSRKDVQRVAREYIDPEKVRTLVVGNMENMPSKIFEMEQVREMELSAPEEAPDGEGFCGTEPSSDQY